MNELELKTEELELLEPSKADSIKKTFEPMVSLIKGFEEEFNEIILEGKTEITDSLTFSARELRIKISKVRINTEKVRVAQKQEYLRAGKAIDGVANIVKWAVTDKEEKLKDIEDHFERVEKERLTSLQFKRWDELKKYLPEDSYEKDLSSMDDDVWNAYLNQKKQDHLDLVQAQKQAELNRIAAEKEAEEARLKMIAENEKLKKEAQQKAKEDEKRIALENKAIQERQKKEADQKAKHEAELKSERDRITKLEADQKAKHEAELKAQKEASDKIQSELNKGDEAKFTDLLNDLNSLKNKYSFKSEKNKKMYNDVSVLIDKVISHIKK